MTGSVQAIQQRDFQSPPFRMSIAILLATIPIGVTGLLLSSMLNACNTQFRSLQVIAIASIVMAVLLAISELTCKHVRRVEDMRMRDALWVGLAQVGALIPGVSRSGATILGGMLFGLNRATATEFSFFLAIPILFAASALDLIKCWKLFTSSDIPMFVVGFFTAFVSAVFVIKFLLRYVATHDFRAFAWYRIIFGVMVLIYFWK